MHQELPELLVPGEEVVLALGSKWWATGTPWWLPVIGFIGFMLAAGFAIGWLFNDPRLPFYFIALAIALPSFLRPALWTGSLVITNRRVFSKLASPSPMVELERDAIYQVVLPTKSADGPAIASLHDGKLRVLTSKITGHRDKLKDLMPLRTWETASEENLRNIFKLMSESNAKAIINNMLLVYIYAAILLFTIDPIHSWPAFFKLAPLLLLGFILRVPGSAFGVIRALKNHRQLLTREEAFTALTCGMDLSKGSFFSRAQCLKLPFLEWCLERVYGPVAKPQER